MMAAEDAVVARRSRMSIVVPMMTKRIVSGVVVPCVFAVGDEEERAE